MLNIDLAEVFDRMEWNFIVAALARKGLHRHSSDPIHACVSSTTFIEVINDQLFVKFRGDRGIWEGCPSSLIFLFSR
jgi:hypothetical protein